MISILGLRIDLDWFYNPDDRDLIRRWTKGNRDETCRHELVIEDEPAPNEPWCFLVLGDTGDSDRFGSHVSPQKAVAAFMAQDCGLIQETPKGEAIAGAPPVQPAARLVLHTGDINYLTGEQRLYDINFVDPYRAFQTEESHFQNLVFRIPFLPVPGNHDYYDLHGWVARIMTIGSWVGLSKILTHFFYRLGLSVPLGGSDTGSAYMVAFVDEEPQIPQPLPYQPGVRTKLPNRYYQFRQGNVHFFALDSNTLDAPPPGTEDPWKVKAPAIRDRAEQKLSRLNEQVERDREWEQQETARLREEMRAGQHEQLWPGLQQLLGDVASGAEGLAAATGRWAQAISDALPKESKQLSELAKKERDLHDRWHQIIAETSAAAQPVVAYEARLDDLINLQEAWLHHLAKRDELTVTMPAAPEYEAARQARLALDARLGSWCRERVGEALPGPCAEPACEEEADVEESPDELDKVDLSEAILDTQRDLALARKVGERSEEDYDAVQTEWLRAGLAAVKAEEDRRREQDPTARIWRIVYMHHPLYTTLPGHTERSDSVGVRRNLEELLQEADVVIAGHSHGFEWLHSSASPNQCYLVTGAGGMNRLQGSIFSPRLASRYQQAITSLTKAGLKSLVWASGEPSSSGGTVEHKLFSYLRIHVLPDELRIEPVGVRHSGDLTEENQAGWERVRPFPVQEVPDAAAWAGGGEGNTQSRHLEYVRIRRGESPLAVWAG
jgi:hypothetical protein